MRSVSRQVVGGLLAAVIGTSACAMHGWRQAIAEYERGLQLSLESPSLLDAGEQVDVKLEIQNRGKQVLTACLGYSRQIHVISDIRTAVQGRPPVGSSGQIVDHPRCERPFKLEPGDRFAWSEAIGIRDIGAGSAGLRVQIQIVSPRHCDRLYGCYDTMLEASARVTIR